jgi:hypothetical protein
MPVQTAPNAQNQIQQDYTNFLVDHPAAKKLQQDFSDFYGR